MDTPLRRTFVDRAEPLASVGPVLPTILSME